MHWLEKMQSTNLGPDAISHNSVMGGCAEGAAHWLEQMQSTNLVPDAISHNSVMGVVLRSCALAAADAEHQSCS